MEYKFQLCVGPLDACPIHWINFVQYCIYGNFITRHDNSGLNAELGKYHGYYHDNALVTFETEDDFIMFKLRWS